MNVEKTKDILSKHPKTAQMYGDGAIWVGYLGDELTIIGVDPDDLFVALSALTENGPLCAQFEVRVGEWRAIISDPHQGVQGVFNTPIHIGEK